VHSLVSVGESFVMPGDGGAFTNVTFRLLVFAPAVGDLLLAAIVAQDDTGMRLSTGFFEDIFLPRYLLLDDMVFDDVRGRWGTPAPDGTVEFVPNDLLRVRVHSLAFNPPSAFAASLSAQLAAKAAGPAPGDGGAGGDAAPVGAARGAPVPPVAAATNIMTPTQAQEVGLLRAEDVDVLKSERKLLLMKGYMIVRGDARSDSAHATNMEGSMAWIGLRDEECKRALPRVGHAGVIGLESEPVGEGPDLATKLIMAPGSTLSAYSAVHARQPVASKPAAPGGVKYEEGGAIELPHDSDTSAFVVVVSLQGGGLGMPHWYAEAVPHVHVTESDAAEAQSEADAADAAGDDGAEERDGDGVARKTG
jgi:hypothetical protein